MEGEASADATAGRRTPASIPFVGREPELHALEEALDRLFQGQGGICLLAGEPGIGKSRLADEVTTRALDRGAVALWGRCWEAGGAPAYWPWVQSLRALLRKMGSQPIEDLGDAAGDLAQLLPEIRHLRPGTVEPPATDPDTARFRLFDAVTRFLQAAATERPLIIAMDDLHAADTPSLLLLRFHGAQTHDTPILLVGTYRDVEVGPEHPLRATIGELLREPHARLLPLGGLSPADVSALIEATAGSRPAQSVAAAVHEETQGNPLFVVEAVRLLAADGRLDDASMASARLGVPDRVRDLIGQRLERLSGACREVLSLASVLGREFSIEALGRVADAAPTDLLGLLDEAAEARVITDVPGTLGGLRFSHALVRDALYDGISPPRRYELHERVARTLESLYGPGDDAHLAEVAHHWLEAAPGGHARRAVDAARRAGGRAMDLLAYEEAGRLYRMAMRALRLGGAGDERERGELLLHLGDAEVRAGDETAAKRTMLEAVEVAREHDLPELLAEAALGYGGRLVWRRAGSDARVIALLEEALASLPAGDSDLRARLMARLSGALRDAPDPERRDALSADAVAMARRLGDEPTLAFALVARYAAIWSPDSTTEQLAIADELKRIAGRLGDPERYLEAVLLRHKALLTLGELDEARAEHLASARLAQELRQPSPRWYVAADAATLALLEGRFGVAEKRIQEARAIGGPAQAMEAETAFRLQTFWLRKEQGRVTDAEWLIRDAVHEFPWYPMFRCALANLFAASERRDEARVALEELAARKFEDLPLDNEWLFGMCLLPEVAVFLGDRAAAELLYRRLWPYSGLAANAAPELWLGPVERYLGILAGMLGQYQEAVDRLEVAIERGLRMGARPVVAHAQCELASALLRRDWPGDRARAREAAAAALRRARELGIEPVARAASLLIGEPPAPTAEAGGPPTGVFRREGDYWTVAFAGEEARLRDSKGLRYLHRLLADPGREVHVAQLASPPAPRSPSGGAEPSLESLDAGHAGELIDPQAKEAYRRRVEDLREEIDEAERWGDSERAARAREELHFITDQLAAAFGLGGRARKGADQAERMRKAVTNRIRDALGRISRDMPSLGRHLSNSVTTGTFCSYSPDRPVHWEVEPAHRSEATGRVAPTE